MTDNVGAGAPKLEVVIAGGGIAGLECALALADLAPERTAVTVIAPNANFALRPLAVREPFAYGAASRYDVQSVVEDAGAQLIADGLESVDVEAQLARTRDGTETHYDALVVAVGAVAHARYEHAITIDDRRIDETLHGLIQDIEGGYVHELAFVIPPRVGWPLPIYELALMSAGRAFDTDAKLDVTIVTPEDRPLAIFGTTASEALESRLARTGVRMITGAYAEIPAPGQISMTPGDRDLHAERIVALPELDGPPIRGLPTGEHGFLHVDPHCRVLDAGPVYAAGDAADFPIKHGGLGSQQADAVAEAIAAQAGASLEPQPFTPVIKGMLLTDDKPLYLSARITGGRGFSSEISESPIDGPPAKVAARYLAPYLRAHDPQLA